jgi:hypothetical protein
VEIVNMRDRPTLVVVNSKRAISYGIARPVLAAIAGPDVDVAGFVEFCPAQDEAIEQRLVDVDLVSVDGVLIARVDLREGPDLSETKENDRNIRQPCISL